MRRGPAVGLLLSGALAALLSVPVARAGGLRQWVLRSITPRHPFADAVAPPAPDYAEARAWSALPEREDLSDRAPPGVAVLPPGDAHADVFFVHSTSSVAPEWNAPWDDPGVVEATDRGGVLNQASAFNGVAAVYAPRYRQATGTAFYTPSPDGAQAIDLAYGDVRRAFAEFLRRRGTERPFLLAGHSQGAAIATVLLARDIAGTPLREKLVAAWLIGTGLTHEALSRHAPDVPPCAGPRDVGCVVAWNARSPDHQPGPIEAWYPPGEHRVCTNPLSGIGEGGPMPASANLGAVFMRTKHPTPLPGFADAACVDGTLVVELQGPVPRDLPSRILAGMLGRGNHHPIEYELFWSNLRADAATRLAAWEAARGG